MASSPSSILPRSQNRGPGAPAFPSIAGRNDCGLMVDPSTSHRNGSRYLSLGLLCRDDRPLGRRQNKSLADEGEALLGEFGLQEFVGGAYEQISVRSRDGCHQVMHGYSLTIHCALLVRVRG